MLATTARSREVKSAGDPVATIEAMKMEAAINAPVSGVVIRVVFAGTTGLEGGDLVLVIE